MPRRSSVLVGTVAYPKLCFILDNNISWLKYPLVRRGFTVFAPPKDFQSDAQDQEILDMAERTGCVVVSTDVYFMDKPMAVYVPHRWIRRYNSWDLVTKIVKLAATMVRKRGKVLHASP